MVCILLMCVVEYGYASMFCVRQTHTEREVYVECTGPETKKKREEQREGENKTLSKLANQSVQKPRRG